MLPRFPLVPFTDGTPERLPIILFPGIFEEAGELRGLIQKIHEQNPDHPIRVYQANTSEAADAAQEADSIAAELIDAVDSKEFTFLFVAFSKNCRTVVDVAQRLKMGKFNPEVKVEVELFLIDGASSDAIISFYHSDKIGFTKELIFILNTAAEISKLSPMHFEEGEIKKFADLDFEPCFEAILNKLSQGARPNDPNTIKFQQRAAIAMRNLVNLLQPTPILVQLPKITLVATDDTITKYGKNLGWGNGNYAKEIEVVSDAVLSKQTHLALIKEPEHYQKLATLIYTAFGEPILRATLKHIVNNHKYPGVKINKVLDDLKSGLSSGSDNDDRSPKNPSPANDTSDEMEVVDVGGVQIFGLFPNMTRSEKMEIEPRHRYNTRRQQAIQQANLLCSPQPETPDHVQARSPRTGSPR